MPVLVVGPPEPWSCGSVGAVDEAQVASRADEGVVDGAAADGLEVGDFCVGAAGNEEAQDGALAAGEAGAVALLAQLDDALAASRRPSVVRALQLLERLTRSSRCIPSPRVLLRG